MSGLSIRGVLGLCCLLLMVSAGCGRQESSQTATDVGASSEETPPDADNVAVTSMEQLIRASPSQKFTDMTDGTSNTYLGGAVPAERAVAWTKPDDICVDESFQKEGNGFAGGKFMVADGMVQAVPIEDGLDEEKFRRMFMSADGHLTDFQFYPPNHEFQQQQFSSSEEQLRHKEASQQQTQAMMQITLAFHNFHDTYGHLPPSTVYGPDGKPWHSWRVLILPFLGEADLYKTYDYSVPWDHPNNAGVLKSMPEIYRDPFRADVNQTTTRYLLGTGPGTAFPTKTM